MAVSAQTIAYVLDQLAPRIEAQAKRMFGGAGLYADGLFFGLISDDVLYFKVDETNRAAYEAGGATAFQPGMAKKPMPYMSVPEDVLEDRDGLADWAATAIAVAARSKK